MNDRLLERDPDPSTGSLASLLTGRADRTLTLVLPETDWQSLRRVEPDPLDWLRRQIRQRLEQGDALDPAAVND